MSELGPVLEALERASRRVGREDEEAERAAAWATEKLVGMGVTELRGLWMGAREAGVADWGLLRQICSAAPVSSGEQGASDHGALYRDLARSLPVDASPEVRLELGALLHEELAELDLARALLEELVEGWPHLGAGWLALGNLLDSQGEVDEAIDALGRAGRLLPGDFGPWLNLGQLLKAEGRFAEAAEAMARCCELDSTAEHLHVWGHCLLLGGDEAGGKEVLARAEEGYGRRIRSKRREQGWNPRWEAEVAPAYFWRGAARCLRGELAGATRDLRRALELDPGLREEAVEEEDYEALRATPEGRALLGL